MICLRPCLVILFNSVNKESYCHFRISQYSSSHVSRTPPHFVVDFSDGHSFFYPLKLSILLFGLVLAKLHLLDSIVSPHYRFKFSSLIPLSYHSRTILLDDGLDSFRTVPFNLDVSLISSCKCFVPSSIIYSLPLGIPYWLSSSKRCVLPNSPISTLSPIRIPDFLHSYSTCIVETRSIDVSLDMYSHYLGPIPCPSQTIVLRHPNPTKASLLLDSNYKRLSYSISHTGVCFLPFRHIIFGSSVLPLALLSFLSRNSNMPRPSSLPLTITFLLEVQCLSSFHLLSAAYPPSIASRVVFQNDEYYLVQAIVKY